jgi:hypothetical protein
MLLREDRRDTKETKPEPGNAQTIDALDKAFPLPGFAIRCQLHRSLSK